MIEHVHLNDGLRVIHTENDIPSADLANTMDRLRGIRTPFDDGYYISAGHIEIADPECRFGFIDAEYLYSLYTPRADVFERWIGFHFDYHSVRILSGALIHHPQQFLPARERLYGALLDGMPHRPPCIDEYPMVEHFPSLLTISLEDTIGGDRDGRWRQILAFAPTFAYAVIKLFEEQ